MRWLSYEILRFHIKEARDDGRCLLPIALFGFDAPGEAVAVRWPQHIEDLQRHRGQRALPDIHFSLHAVSLYRAVIWLANTRMSHFPLGKQQVGAQRVYVTKRGVFWEAINL